MALRQTGRTKQGKLLQMNPTEWVAQVPFPFAPRAPVLGAGGVEDQGDGTQALS